MTGVSSQPKFMTNYYLLVLSEEDHYHKLVLNHSGHKEAIKHKIQLKTMIPASAKFNLGANGV